MSDLEKLDRAGYVVSRCDCGCDLFQRSDDAPVECADCGSIPPEVKALSVEDDLFIMLQVRDTERKMKWRQDIPPVEDA